MPQRLESTDAIPELPERRYLQDIDFVAQEFDLFFQRPPDIPSRYANPKTVKQEEDCVELEVTHSNKVSVIDRGTEETSHYMSLIKTQEDECSSTNVYQSLTCKTEQPFLATVSDKESSIEKNQYQPLTMAKGTSESHSSSVYQTINSSSS